MGNRNQIPRCESKEGIDHEQELGGESDVVWFWSAGELSMGIVQENAEEWVEREGGCCSFEC